MGKFGWDLPPGCSINDIPGNRPEDVALEDAEQAIVDKLYEANATINDYHLIVALIKPLIETYQKEIAQVQEEMNANHAEYIEWLKCEIGGMLNEIESDERFKAKDVTVHNNAPLALIQSQMDGEVLAYKKVLKLMGEKID